MSMKQIADGALDTVTQRGAGYADVRLVDHRQRSLATKNGKVGHAGSAETLGIGIRVLVNDSWGFAATDDLSREAVDKTAAHAVEIAKASSRVKEEPVRLAPEPAVKIEWSSPYKIDPFTTSIEQNLDLLTRIDAELLAVKGVTLAESSMQLGRYEQWFYNIDGSDIHQTRVLTGAGFCALAFQGTEIMKRSYPNSFGGQHQNRGYELVDELNLLENARRIGQEAVALHKAERCPEGRTNVVLDSSQLGLQIHESVGHPIELDRVLGMEANFAGMSFLTLEKLNTLRYGSEIVNVVADARLQHGPGLGTFGYDDEGVPAQCTPIIKDGLFTGYLSDRETAGIIGQKRSGGTMRTESWNRLPIIRMTNISILPGTWRYDDLIADTDDAILMETNRSWSIDDRRYHFQFSAEIAWELKGGKKGRMLKHPSYSGITTEFWNSCDAICSRA